MRRFGTWGGHTDNDIVIRVPDAAVVFAGDLLENEAAPGYGDAYPSAWAETVAELRAMAELGRRVASGELDEDKAVRRSPFPAGTARTAIARAALELAPLAEGADRRRQRAAEGIH